MNRLVAITSRSFPQYLMYSRPFVPPGYDQVWDTLKRIVEDQNQLVERYYQLLEDAEIVPKPGHFPLEFTDTHDLSIDFLLREAIVCQQQDIAAISQSVEDLQPVPAAKALAEETLCMAKGHLELLEEAARELTAA